MPTFIVTQVVKGYRKFDVEAETWEEARLLVEKCCPTGNSMTPEDQLPATIKLVECDTSEDALDNGPVCFVDSADTGEACFES